MDKNVILEKLTNVLLYLLTGAMGWIKFQKGNEIILMNKLILQKDLKIQEIS